MATEGESFFVVLAELDPAHFQGHDFGLALNILEMLGCVLFRSLPSSTLRPWLPAIFTSELTNEVYLNVYLPLLQGQVKDPEKEWIHLKNTTDPILKAYYEGRVSQATAELAKARERREETTRKKIEEEIGELKEYNTDKKRATPRRAITIRGLLMTVPSNIDTIPGRLASL